MRKKAGIENESGESASRRIKASKSIPGAAGEPKDESTSLSTVAIASGDSPGPSAGVAIASGDSPEPSATVAIAHGAIPDWNIGVAR